MYATPDPTLPEAIHALRHLELHVDARRLVDEAAQLLGDGREIEARALVEKAEALAGHTPAAVPGNGAAKASPALSPEERHLQQIASRLSAGITNAFSSALLEVHRLLAEQSRDQMKIVDGRLGALESNANDLSSRIAGHDDRLAAFDQLLSGFTPSLAALAQRVDDQTSALVAMQDRHSRRAAVLNEVLGNLAKLREDRN